MQNSNRGFERSQFINMVVFAGFILAVLLFFQYFNKEDKKKQAEQQVKTEQTEKIVKAVASHNGEKSVLKNDELTLEISNLGGQISSVRMNQYSSYDRTDKNKPLYLFNNENSNYGFTFKDKAGKLVSTKDLNFTPTVNGNVITLQAQLESATIQFIYTLQKNYKVDFQVKTEGLSKVTNDNKAEFTWDYQALATEKGRTQQQGYTEFVYSFDNYSSYDYDGRGEMEETEETLDWIGVKSQFFTAVFEAKNLWTKAII